MIQNFLAVRTTTDLVAVLPAMRRAVSAVEPDASIWRAQTMDELLAGPLAQPRLGAVLMSGFGIASLLLASIGLYGVMASTVRERTRDIGVRMALGATPQRVRRDVLNQAIQTFGVGVLVGLVGALAMSRLLTTLLFDVSPADPIAFVSAASLLFVVALAAAYIPARRATRIDPAQALRIE
jgi:ABC-type antimicrobial peptide transport system permease subunit